MRPTKSNLPDPTLLRKHSIKHAMGILGLTQKDIARALGVTPQAVHAVISGRMTSRRVQRYLSRRLGVPYKAWWGSASSKVRVA